MKKSIFPLLLTALVGLAAAPAATAQPTAKAPAYQDPKQYGRPFKGVPAPPDAAIYQVNMRGFSPEGTFKAILPRLDSIKALGVNVVYLMPVFPIGKEKAVDSPFAVQNYTGVNPEFGTLADLRELVDAAHRRNMAVILDWVGNHTSWDHAWIKQHPDWYVRDAQGQIVNPIPEWKDIAQLDFSKPALRQAMIQSMRYWVFAANVDGFRFDYADGPTYEFFAETSKSLNSIKGHRLLLLAEGAQKRYFFKAGFPLCYDFGFAGLMHHDVFGKGRSVRAIDSLNTALYKDAPAEARMVRYVSNHDLNAWDGTPQEMFGGLRGSVAAFVVAAYMQAVPMVYNGQEIGHDQRVPFMGARRPIVWTPNPALTTEYRRLLRLRAASPALRRGQLASFSSDDVCAFTKTEGAEQIFTLVNLRNRPVSYSVPGNVAATAWHDAFTGQPATVRGTVMLQPFQYLVLRNQPGGPARR